ncbi:MarR family winged helix-turn-helix transcriptional regulator [Sorangium sp. So ce1000]|uniref:MarR family winged helix-turn-helix transcriptional regulator n=1 Tax=Sorangium sp. So ce1000 TaxID=3133325 RepID=UPI003F6354D4
MGAHTSSAAPRKGAARLAPGGPDAQRVMDAIRAIVQRLRVSSRACERQLGLSSAQLFVLQQLDQAAASSIAELAQRTLTHQSSVSVVVTRLAERGLVARRASPEDARRTEISLTPAGRALLRRAPRTAQAELVAAVDRLPADERRALAQSLTTLARALGAGDEAPPLFFEGEEPLAGAVPRDREEDREEKS